MSIYSYPDRVEPHLTDYAGVVWHGSYLRWLEEARIDALRQVGIEYADLVGLGCDLPVLRIEINYCRALLMGERALVKTQVIRRDRVRVLWQQNIYKSRQGRNQFDSVAVESQITIAPVSIKKKQIMRQAPIELEDAFVRLMT